MLRPLVAAAVLTRLARGRTLPLPLAPGAPAPSGTVSVVVPARDEEDRIAGCLAPLQGDLHVGELLVVDDRSADRTAQVAAAHGARVVAGAPRPEGWAGKAWALEQGLRAATGDWVVFLDADTRPKPGLIAALVELAARFDLLSAGPRFVCESPGERLLHPALAATLPYRTGPADVDGWQPRPGRALANGQCVAVRRAPFLARGGWALVHDQLVEDVALARRLRRDGRTVGFADAADLLDVRMYESAGATLTGWGRSLMAPGVSSPAQTVADLAVLWIAMALPLPRVLARRANRLDLALLAMRLGIHGALARGYRPRGLPYALAPVADLPVVAWLTWCALRPSRTWRGRTYGRRRGRR